MARRALGIDVGAGSLKLVLLEAGKAGPRVMQVQKLRTDAFAEEDAAAARKGSGARGKGQGEEAGAEPQVSSLKPQASIALLRELRRHLRAAPAVVGLSGRDVILKYSKLATEDVKKIPVLMEMELSELREKAEDLAADYQVLETPGLRGESLALVGLAKAPQVAAKLALLARGGARVTDVTATPLGLYHGYLLGGELRDREVQLVLDVGRRNTQVVLLEEGRLLGARTLGLGGEHFTRAVQEALGVAAATAEDEVRRATVHPDRWSDDRVGRACKPVADALGQQMLAAVQVCKTQLEAPKLRIGRVFLNGDGARLDGLREHLMGTFAALVEYYDPWAALDLEGLDATTRAALTDEGGRGRGADFTAALGLARLGLEPATPRLSFMPAAIRRRARFWRETAWLYAAGVAALVALAWATARSSNYEEVAAALRQSAAAKQAAEDADLRDTDQRRRQSRELGVRALALHDAVDAPARLGGLLDAVRHGAPPEVFLLESAFTTDAQGAGHLTLLAFLEKKDRDWKEVDAAFVALLEGLPGIRTVIPDRVQQTPEGIKEEWGKVVKYDLAFGADPFWERVRTVITPADSGAGR